MKHIKSLFVCSMLIILFSKTSTAQYYFGEYVNQSISLRSDIPSKSVLVSNLLSESAGDNSPLIGAANWTDSGRQFECRSLLTFNYFFLPRMIINDPSLINSAELILFPLQISFSQHDADKPAKFMVRRVVQNWEDSTTTWINQPSSDSTVQATKVIKVKNKNSPVSVDVTKLVLKMIRNGNNGFLICPENSSEGSMASGQLFASPKYQFEELRPILVINYRKLTDPYLSVQSWLQNTANPHPANMIPRDGTEAFNRIPLMEPVKEPVLEPSKTNPVKE